jgi:hypothetical protein
MSPSSAPAITAIGTRKTPRMGDRSTQIHRFPVCRRRFYVLNKLFAST